jgi:hypothetical protein
MNSMETLRTLSVNTARAACLRALGPSIVLSVAVALDQCTRGPSITAMLLTAYFNGGLALS